MNATTILEHTAITHRIKRMAFQIYEFNAMATEVYIAGIAGGGYDLAQLLAKALESISEIKVYLIQLTLDKNKPLSPAQTDIPLSDITGHSLVLVDDVLNSGTTLMYGIRHFLDIELSQFKTAVLVDRNHKKYPVKADFKGISLSTSMNEHVKVAIQSQPYTVTLE